MNVERPYIEVTDEQKDLFDDFVRRNSSIISKGKVEDTVQLNMDVLVDMTKVLTGEPVHILPLPQSVVNKMLEAKSVKEVVWILFLCSNTWNDLVFEYAYLDTPHGSA
jgi:hypothetical protein